MDKLEDGEGLRGENLDTWSYLENEIREEQKPDSVIITDPEIFSCPNCFETFSTPVFQCENGHVICSVCCPKLKNKCSSCRLPTGFIRCRFVEKLLESAKVLCPNAKYGCKETISLIKKLEHQINECQYAPCSCPFSDCNSVPTFHYLYRHLSDKHKSSTLQFRFNQEFHITLNANDKFLIIQEETDGVLFIVKRRTFRRLWNEISVVHIGPRRDEKMKFKYDIIATYEHGWGTMKFQSYTTRFHNKDEADDYSLCGDELHPITFRFTSCDRPLKLDICIWGNGISL